jgi:hypothetical protein
VKSSFSLFASFFFGSLQDGKHPDTPADIAGVSGKQI